MKTHHAFHSSLVITCILILLNNFSSLAQTTYTWIGANNASWATGTNWSPTRTTPAANDILQFNDGTTKNVTSVPTQTVGRLLISSNTNITLQSNGTITLTVGNGSGDDLIISSGSTLIIGGSNTITITLNANASALIGGSLTINSGRTFTAGGTLASVTIAGTVTNSGTYNTSTTTAVTTVSGNFINSGTISNSTTARLIFSSGSIYQHSQNGGSIPAATWNATSTCLITGIVGTNPSFAAGQTFGNFTWNCTSQTVDANFNTLFNIAGNLTINSTGSGIFRLAIGTTNVNGNYSQTGGTNRLSGSSPRTLSIDGNVSITGGELRMNSSTAIGTMNLKGNFSHTGGLINETNSGSGLIVFNGTGIQTYTSGGTVTNTINFTVNSGATLQMAAENTVVSGAGTFTLSSGATLGIRSAAGITSGTSSGNIQTTGRSFSTGANYIYNGTVAQSIGAGFPTGLTGTLTINNSGNTVTLGNARTIGNAGSINLVAGTFSAGTNLTMASTSTINRSGGSMTGTLQGSGTYNVNFTGNSKTTGDELGGSGLNNVTINLGDGQTLTLNQSRIVHGTLTMTVGDIALNGNTLTLGTDATKPGTLIHSSGLLTGTGTFTRWYDNTSISLGTAKGLFPMGSGSDNRNVWIAGTPTAGGTVSVQHTNATGTTAISFTENSQTFDKRTNMSWTVGNGNGFTATGMSLRIQGSGIPGINNVNDLNICIATGVAGGTYSAPGGTATDPLVNRTGLTQTSLANTFYFASTASSPLPVELSSFTASLRNNNVQLEWTTETEVDNYGFEIQRQILNQVQDDKWTKIGFVNGAGNSNSPKFYSFKDDKLPYVNSVFYRLKQIDSDGSFEYSDSVEVSLAVNDFVLEQNYPNPFNPSTSISFKIPEKSNVTLTVYNSLGEVVDVLANTQLDAGIHTFNWNANGYSSGIYFYTLTTKDKTLSKKMLLLK